MLFNSYAFLFVFLPLCLGFYFVLGRIQPRWGIWSLFIASVIFYGYWNWCNPIPNGTPEELAKVTDWDPRRWNYTLLLMLSVLFNYGMGIQIKRRRSSALLVLAVTVNLLVLAYYKYADLLLHTVGNLFHVQTPASLEIILPLGISFFTFTQIAYLCDARRGEADESDFARYGLFVTFFPHSIAGPILHHKEMMPQFSAQGAQRWCSANVQAGIVIFCLGLAKKVLIADPVAPWANAAFSQPEMLTILDAWTGLFAYTFQLYFDFSGYSDMAIGLALLFNVRLPENFDSPYKATSIVDFWRRWHMTLSRWLRDYLYIPLGGSRHGNARRLLNLLITMLLGGLWHGASWTFLIWGGYHGLLLVLCHIWTDSKLPFPRWLGRALTFLAVMFGWVLFRSSSFDAAGHYFHALFDVGSYRLENLPVLQSLTPLAVLLALLVAVNVAPNTREWAEKRVLTKRHALLLAVLFALSLLAMRSVVLQEAKSEFIYFQF